MTRGRKKDLTIPATRALAQQRDYRARKARYVSDLEDRCRAAEEDNARLKKELELAKAGVPTAFSSETAQASSELLKHLNAASASLSQFHRLAFPYAPQTQPPIQPLTNLNVLRPASFPSPTPSIPTPSASDFSLNDGFHFPKPTVDHADINSLHTSERLGELPFSREAMSSSPSMGSECCGGFIDCTDEEHDELLEEDQQASASVSVIKTSGMRYMSDDRL